MSISVLSALIMLVFVFLIFTAHAINMCYRFRKRHATHYPPAEPFHPQITDETVVDACVVFVNHDEATNHIAANNNIPLTPVTSLEFPELPEISPPHSPSHTHTPMAQRGTQVGNVLQPSEEQLEVAAKRGEKGTRRVVTYRLRSASFVYGTAEYSPRSHSVGEMPCFKAEEVVG